MPKCGKVPDILGVSGNHIILAVEMKVSAWQRALRQATLYTMFASESYVAMPEDKEELLRKNIWHFERWNIGILIVGKDNNVRLLRSPSGDPHVSNEQSDGSGPPLW